jgi:hypothetical protein
MRVEDEDGVMGVTSRNGGEPDLVAHYGFARWHAASRLWAAEERIDIDRMERYGGSVPWASTSTPLRPILDLDFPRPVSLDDCVTLRRRLAEIRRSWSEGEFVGDSDDDAKRNQLQSLQQLIMVLGSCIHLGKGVLIE